MVAPRAFRRFVLAAVASASLLGSFAAASPASAATLPTQGIFESCQLQSELAACEQRLNVMHSGGLQVVVTPPSGASLDSLAQYANAAHSLGMSVMWELSDPSWWQQGPSGTGAGSHFSEFASACSCSTNGDVLAFMVHWLGSLPGTYGYYAADDSMLSPGDQPGVAAYVASIKQQDASHTVLIGAANTNQAQQYQSTAALVAQETYPITTASLMPQSTNQATWDSVAQTAAVTQQAADRAGKPSAVILQSFSWGDALSDGQAIGVCNSSDTTASCAARLRYPSGAEQLALRNTVLQNAHPQLILWFSFQGTYGFAEPESYFAPISPDEAAARWAGLSAAIQAPPPSGAVAAAAQVTAKKASVKPKHHKKHKKAKKHKKVTRHKKHKAAKRAKTHK